MIKIVLTDNRADTWYQKENIYAKGFLFDNNEQLLKGNDLCDYFKNVNHIKKLNQLLISTTGQFSLIIRVPQGVIFAIDHARHYPLFYSLKNNNLIISDSVYRLTHFYSDSDTKIKNESISEFLCTGFVTGNKTLFQDIYQVKAGEILSFINNQMTALEYHHYSILNPVNIEYNQLLTKARQILNNCSDRLVRTLENKTAVIPLSGGYDSRLIAVMLKNAGYNNVICFTFGRPGNNEIAISKKVARTLGFQWIFIPYNQQLISHFLEDESFKDYYSYAAEGASMFFMQEFFAIKYLTKHHLIPPNSIFIPGHSGDALGGSQLNKNFVKPYYSLNQLTHKIYHDKFIYNTQKKDFKHLTLSNIKKDISLEYKQGALPYSIYENWDYKEKLAKFIINSCRVFNFFGYQYRLPFYDRNVLDFFAHVPYKIKKDKTFYDELLTNYFFEKHKLNFKNELQPSQLTIKIQKVKNLFKKLMPGVIIKKILIKHDWNFYYNITHEFKKDLIHQGKKVKMSFPSFNTIIIQWYVNQIKKIMH